ncbi:hypothetical protein LZ554_007745 [Drepanopeziza brunnea f. sp. 'monogermtubi']|nr:hypothetical protein LZ554_007745 [Drepanopeziza brunnea f. sp. 'monogermtubi']
MDDDRAKEEVSLLSEFYTDDGDHQTQSPPTPPPDFHTKNEEGEVTRSQTTLGSVKYLLGQIIFLMKTALLSLVPSFIPRYGSTAREPLSDRRLSPTAYLDGLRGIACFAVFLVHFVHNWFPGLNHTYGATPADNHFFQLPIFRVIMGGEAAVSTFFVISGYALSYRALSKIQEGNKAESLDVLSSSTFRRCMRIHLPCGVNTFICMLLQYNGLFTQDPLQWNTIPPRLPTFPAQLQDWWAHQMVLMYPFHDVESGPYSPPYNGHMWTILLEIRGSFVVYGTVLAVAKLTPFWRAACLVAFDSYLWYMAKWDLFLFVSGIILANLDIPRHVAAKRGNLPPAAPEGEVYLPTHEPGMVQMTIETPKHHHFLSKVMQLKQRNSARFHRITGPISRVVRMFAPYVLFIVALWLLSVPHVPFGNDFLYSFVPARYATIHGFFGKETAAIRIIGSVLLAFCLSLSPASPPRSKSDEAPPPSLFSRVLASRRKINLQWLFTNAFSQYLGRVSFGFYLMHGPVLFCIGTKILSPAASAWNANHDDRAYQLSFAKAVVVNTICVFFAADWFARVVDERSVRWASAVARFMSRKAKSAAVSGS